MAEKKQLLIIEDLGTSKEDVQQLVAQAELPYELIWNQNSARADSVEALVTVKKTIGKDLLNKYPKLKVIAVAFTGFDSVDIEVANKKGIAVYNVPAYSTNSVSELAIALTISLLRKIPEVQSALHNDDWAVPPGLELAGRTVGVLGTGTIGLTVAKVFKALNCKLIGWSRTQKDEFKQLGGRYIADKKEFFTQADIVSVHLPHNKETEGIVGADELSAMKKSAYIVNTARGPIIDEKALINSLKEGAIAGAGIDVFAQEPINRDNELLDLDNVVLTPHIAFKTEEALERRAKVTVRNLNDFLNGVKTNQVN